MQTFFQKNTDISKIKKALVQKDIFPETNYVCVLTYRISSIILTILRRGVILLPPTSKRTPEKPTQIRVKYHVLFQDQSSDYIREDKIIDMIEFIVF